MNLINKLDDLEKIDLLVHECRHFSRQIFTDVNVMYPTANQIIYN